MNSVRDIEQVISPEVTILISTYNGGKFLAQQLESILNQDFTNWVAVIRDDGSSDNTLDIIKSFGLLSSKFKFVTDAKGNLGPSGSFVELLKYVESSCFMFCDQDDVWLPNKVGDTLAALGVTNAPHLVFTDLVVVDEQLQEISSSFMKFSRLDPYVGIRFPKLIFQNVVVGCTVAGNQALIQASRLDSDVLPRCMLMHDWWLAITACVFGKITYLNRRTILYRQHGGNCLGAKKSGFRHYISLLRHGKPWNKAHGYLDQVTTQAVSFSDFYSSNLPAKERSILSKLASTRRGYTPFKILLCFLSGISMQSFDRGLALFLSFLLRPTNILNEPCCAKLDDGDF